MNDSSVDEKKAWDTEDTLLLVVIFLVVFAFVLVGYSFGGIA